MICHFSGTGNSLAVAQMLSALLADDLLPMTTCLAGRMPRQEVWTKTDVLCLVCPVYAWGVPRIVERFATEVLAPAVTKLPHSPRIYIVLTCGDDIGMADKRFCRLLRSRGLTLTASFSVAMPNTYVGLPGFDVDAPHVRDGKLAACPERVRTIAEAISKGTTRVADVRRGALPRLKTYVLRPLFNLFFTGDRRFSTDDSCSRCGLCVRSCPVGNIRPDLSGRPTWTGHCADCLRCYHLCPHHSIAYGKHSRGTGQYVHRALLHKDFPQPPSSCD